MNSQKKRLIIINIAIPLGIAILAAILVNKDFSIYNSLRRPKLSPPFYIFPIVWSLLYTFMGISAYLITAKKTIRNEIDVYTGYVIYGLSLLLNVIWMLLFFKAKHFFASLVVLGIIIVVIFSKITAFARISKAAALLQVPYLLWSLFAAYLNMSIYTMN